MLPPHLEKTTAITFTVGVHAPNAWAPHQQPSRRPNVGVVAHKPDILFLVSLLTLGNVALLWLLLLLFVVIVILLAKLLVLLSLVSHQE